MVLTVDHDPSPSRPACDLDQAAPVGVYLVGVLEQIDEHLLEQHRVDRDQRNVGLDVDGDLRGSRVALRGGSAPSRSISSSGTQSFLSAMRAGFEPRHVEQVARPALEALGLFADRLEQLAAACSRRAPGRRAASVAAPVIAASGVRRSCETAESKSRASLRSWRASADCLASLDSRARSRAMATWRQNTSRKTR